MSNLPPRKFKGGDIVKLRVGQRIRMELLFGEKLEWSGHYRVLRQVNPNGLPWRWVILDGLPHPQTFDGSWMEDTLELAEIPYDPNQQGDQEDDI